MNGDVLEEILDTDFFELTRVYFHKFSTSIVSNCKKSL